MRNLDVQMILITKFCSLAIGHPSTDWTLLVRITFCISFVCFKYFEVRQSPSNWSTREVPSDVWDSKSWSNHEIKRDIQRNNIRQNVWLLYRERICFNVHGMYVFFQYLPCNLLSFFSRCSNISWCLYHRFTSTKDLHQYQSRQLQKQIARSEFPLLWC